MDIKYMTMAVDMSLQSVQEGGGPFGSVIVRNDQVISYANNMVTLSNDPTAHDEIVAIRHACLKEGSHSLKGCTLYSSCEPCPMCLSACYWAGIDKIYFANNRKQAAQAGFDDEFIYDEFGKVASQRRIPMIHMDCPDAFKAFEAWQRKEDKILY